MTAENEAGDIIPGVGVLIDCPSCEGAGKTRRPDDPNQIVVTCPRCAGSGLLLDDGATLLRDEVL